MMKYENHLIITTQMEIVYNKCYPYFITVQQCGFKIKNIFETTNDNLEG